jgi:hypothetical protein
MKRQRESPPFFDQPLTLLTCGYHYKYSAKAAKKQGFSLFFRKTRTFLEVCPKRYLLRVITYIIKIRRNPGFLAGVSRNSGVYLVHFLPSFLTGALGTDMPGMPGAETA